MEGDAYRDNCRDSDRDPGRWGTAGEATAVIVTIGWDDAHVPQIARTSATGNAAGGGAPLQLNAHAIVLAAYDPNHLDSAGQPAPVGLRQPVGRRRVRDPLDARCRLPAGVEPRHPPGRIAQRGRHHRGADDGLDTGADRDAGAGSGAHAAACFAGRVRLGRLRAVAGRGKLERPRDAHECGGRGRLGLIRAAKCGTVAAASDDSRPRETPCSKASPPASAPSC